MRSQRPKRETLGGAPSSTLRVRIREGGVTSNDPKEGENRGKQKILGKRGTVNGEVQNLGWVRGKRSAIEEWAISFVWATHSIQGIEIATTERTQREKAQKRDKDRH